MRLSGSFEGHYLEVDVDYCPEEGSTSSASEHYYGGHFAVKTVYLQTTDGEIDITDLLGKDRVELIEEYFAEVFYDGDF